MKEKGGGIMKITEVIRETAEGLRDRMKESHYAINVDKKGVAVKKLRPTKHTIKWRSKNH